MALEKPRSTEGFAADLASAGQSVGPNMHLESSHGLVLLATVLATIIIVLVTDDLEWLSLKNFLLLFVAVVV